MSNSVASAPELVTMLIPVRGKQLLVPNVTVAEIIHLAPIRSVDDVPTWFTGLIAWRDCQIPVISFEAINDEPFVSVNPDMRVAVFNGTADPQRLPFYGVTTQGMPRLLRLTAEEIGVNDDVVTGAAEAGSVHAAGESASIPDIDYIEERLLAVIAELGLTIAV